MAIQIRFAPAQRTIFSINNLTFYIADLRTNVLETTDNGSIFWWMKFTTPRLAINTIDFGTG